MNIFDIYIEETLHTLTSCDKKRLVKPEKLWPVLEKNTFLMERDTAIELGGYPKESINLILASEHLKEKGIPEGVYCIGDPGMLSPDTGHISFGKIVLLETEHIPEEELYTFTQDQLMADARIRMKDVMLRQSPTHYTINLRVGKKAMAAGFHADTLGFTIQDVFCRMKYVKAATVILLFGETKLYKELLPVAEKAKEVTLTLNHIFDGIEMDCGHCEQQQICSEVEGMRALHRRQLKKDNQAKV